MTRIATRKTEQRHQNHIPTDLKKTLLVRKEQLAARIGVLLGDVVADREPDDEGAFASESYAKDLTAAMLERERNMLNEIEVALSRIKAGEYGVCDVCGVSIPNARLEALPWAHLCVGCAERSAAA